MPSLVDVLSFSALIYSDIVEPIFCLFYAYILLRIWQAKSNDLKGAFFQFSIATGICAIGNITMNLVLRLIDVRFQYFPDRGTTCNILMFLSHVCALSVSLGKTLSVATRYTAICHIYRKDFWEGRMMIGSLALAFYAYFPFLPPVFGVTSNGYGVYLGIAHPGFLIAKAFATCGYFLFFLATVPMCTLAVIKLRSERLSARLSSRHEKILGIYAVVLTTSHMFKTILQSVWFVALVLGMKELQTAVISQYLIPNTLSAFAEPVLLLVTSSKLRDEVFPWRVRRRRNNNTTSIPTNSSATRRATNDAS